MHVEADVLNDIFNNEDMEEHGEPELKWQELKL